jgi:hypothetical protein
MYFVEDVTPPAMAAATAPFDGAHDDAEVAVTLTVIDTPLSAPGAPRSGHVVIIAGLLYSEREPDDND